MQRANSQVRPIIIRPSGIWDSRAPFGVFAHEHKRINREHSVTALALLKLRRDAAKIPGDFVTRGYFTAARSRIGGFARQAWLSYRRSLGWSEEGRERPTFSQLDRDAQSAYLESIEHSIIAYTAMFEVHVQCWALNYLLSKLEAGDAWSAHEAKLSRRFARVQFGQHAPNFPAIRDAIGFLGMSLANLGHVQVADPSSGPRRLPLSDELNALRTIEFWREYRNLLVHSSGLASHRFFNDNRRYVEALRAYFPALPTLVEGRHLNLRDDVFRMIAHAHFDIARTMNEWLEDTSKGYRGASAVEAPDSERHPARAKMLRDGDHAESLRWVSESSFRAEIRREMSSP